MICSAVKNLEVVKGNLKDYNQLCRFHYRDTRLGPFAAIFALKSASPTSDFNTVGVIVYTMPSTGVELRNVATNNMFCGFDTATRLAVVNKTIRCIGRVIIEPRFRGLGLAHRLVSETMPKLNVPIIEAVAVMGQVNPFFEKAGMTAYTAKTPARCVQLIEAFSFAAIEGKDLIDPQIVLRKLSKLPADKARFLDTQINYFLQSYGKRRYMQRSAEQIRYVLSKLTARPVYYIWFNPRITIEQCITAAGTQEQTTGKTR